MTRDEIERRLLSWMTREPWHEDEARFETLALATFAHQFAHCAPYRRFCEGRGRTPDRVTRWQEIPAVPSGAFKELALRSFDEADEIKTFRTSGTSRARADVGHAAEPGGAGSAPRRGELHLDSLALYEASLAPSFARGVWPDLGPDERTDLFVLAPRAAELPDSSLSHMFGVLLERRGRAHSGCFVEHGVLKAEALERAIAAADGAPTIAGTAFSFVHWLESREARGERARLPAGTRLMETGGFKGRARERSQRELYAELEDALGVPASRIVNQYGMTELGSQFYDSVLVDPDGPRRKRVPAWVRVRFLDPESECDVATGAPGMIQILDLANLGSVAAVLTADLGRAVIADGAEPGFEVIGRAPGAEARGCSIAADEMLLGRD